VPCPGWRYERQAAHLGWEGGSEFGRHGAAEGIAEQVDGLHFAERKQQLGDLAAEQIRTVSEALCVAVI